jgi:mRNA interferase MazF
MNKEEIRRGDLYFAELPPGVGSEQSGFRPAVILQNDTGNRHSTTVIVAPITSRISGKPNLPTHCRIKAQTGIGRDSVVLLEQVQTIDKCRLREYIGALDGFAMNKVNNALAVSFGLKSSGKRL